MLRNKKQEVVMTPWLNGSCRQRDDEDRSDRSSAVVLNRPRLDLVSSDDEDRSKECCCVESTSSSLHYFITLFSSAKSGATADTAFAHFFAGQLQDSRKNQRSDMTS